MTVINFQKSWFLDFRTTLTVCRKVQSKTVAWGVNRKQGINATMPTQWGDHEKLIVIFKNWDKMYQAVTPTHMIRSETVTVKRRWWVCLCQSKFFTWFSILLSPLGFLFNFVFVISSCCYWFTSLLKSKWEHKYR